MDVSKVVTITADTIVDGELGVYTFYFYPYRQYVFVDSENVMDYIDNQVGI